MKPEQILAKLAERYKTCPSYRDVGCVKTNFLGGLECGPQVKPFQTAFIRPDRFRFEYKDGARYRYIVWAFGADVRTSWDLRPGIERKESIGMALAGPAGVSGGSAHTVPALLMPDRVGGRRLTDLVELALHGQEEVDGVVCFRLIGRFVPLILSSAEEERLRAEAMRVIGRPRELAQRSPLTVWVDRDSFLLRRIEEAVQFETFRTETVTTYDPAIAVEISEDELAF